MDRRVRGNRRPWTTMSGRVGLGGSRGPVGAWPVAFPHHVQPEPVTDGRNAVSFLYHRCRLVYSYMGDIWSIRAPTTIIVA